MADRMTDTSTMTNADVALALADTYRYPNGYRWHILHPGLRRALVDLGWRTSVTPQNFSAQFFKESYTDWNTKIKPFLAPWRMTKLIWEELIWHPYVSVAVHTPDETGEEDYGIHVGYLANSIGSFNDPFPEKPSWRDLHNLIYQRDLNAWSSVGGLSAWVKASRDHYLQAPVPHALSDVGIEPGDGLAHMPALIYSAHRSTFAGKHHPASVLKTDDSSTLKIWTEEEADDLLGNLAAETNVAESARNLLTLRGQRLQAAAEDKTGGLPDTATDDEAIAARDRALDAYAAFLDVEYLTGEIIKLVKELQAEDDLPAGPALARKVLLERIEDAATARMADIKAAITQQGVDLDPSCDDQADAVRSVSKIKQLAQINLHRSSLEGEQAIAALRTIFDEAKQDIEAVAVLNTPVWTVDGTPATLSTTEVSTRTIVFGADHPAGAVIEGNAYITSGRDLALNEDGDVVDNVIVRIASHGTGSRATVTIPDTVAENLYITLTARNLCGPNKIRVKIVLSPPPP